VADRGQVDTGYGFTYTWFVTRNNASYPVATPTNQPTFSFPTPTDGATYVVMLTVADKDGGVVTAQSQLVLGTAGDDNITIPATTAPAGGPGLVVLAMGGNDKVD